MFGKKNIDLLLSARPDHSMQIYKALLNQKEMSFLYNTFKYLPRWTEKIVHNKRAHFKDGFVSNSYLMTIHNYLSYNMGWKFLINIPEQKIFEHHLNNVLKNYSPRLIHYWPIYCYEAVAKYKETHPNVTSIAEIYMLNSQYILDNVEPIMIEYGLERNLDYIKKEQILFEKIMRLEDNFMVPSQLVADSYLKYFPNKHFTVMPFGITISPLYKKKGVLDINRPFRFVYCGTISVEKGCDILCKWIRDHDGYEVHLFGSIKASEKSIFDEYSNCQKIHFMGHVAKNELQSKLQQYDAGIHLSRFDAYSLAVGEMTGIGLPLLVSDQTGNKDDVLNHELGLVTSLDVDSITNAIYKISDSNIYSRIVDNIDKYIASSPVGYGDAMVRKYKEMIYG